MDHARRTLWQGAGQFWYHLKGGFTVGVDKELLEILACPKCKGEVRLDEEEDGLICEHCRLKYPIRDDIPVMLIDEAIELE